MSLRGALALMTAVVVLVLGAVVAETGFWPWTRTEVAVAASTLQPGHRIAAGDIAVEVRQGVGDRLGPADVVGSVALAEIPEGGDVVAADILEVADGIDLRGRVPLAVTAVPAQDEPPPGSVATLVLSPEEGSRRSVVVDDVVVMRAEAGDGGTAFTVAVRSEDLSELAPVLGSYEVRVVAAFPDGG